MYSLPPLRNTVRNGSVRVVARRNLFPSQVARRLSSTSTMHDNDPELLDTEKQRNLSGKQHKTSTPHADAPGWNEHLASASEAGVKADRHSGGENVSQLQARTVEYVTSRHSPDERTGPTVASYPKDEVEGPLSGRGRRDPDEVVTETTTVETTTARWENPTPSEEDVKADRGEPIIGHP